MYDHILLDLSRDTRYRCSEPLARPLSERRNPACGDEVAVSADLDEGRISHPVFYAQGCAVCVASAAALCDTVANLPLDSASGRIAEALAYFDEDGDWTADWGTPALPALGAVRSRPMRMACVRLAWEGMREALHNNPDTTT